MSDAGFREIHLSGKHVVFLFMAGAVAAVGIFLLGVSVGKGITKPETVSAQATVPPTTGTTDASPTATPESSKPKSGELEAYRTMQEKGAPRPSASPSPAAVTPAATPESPSPTPALKPSPTPSPEKPAATGAWFVLVDSFSSRTNAEKRMAELKKKGYTPKLTVTTGSKPLYKVRLGPFDDRPAADVVSARLRKEGYQPSVTR